MFYRLITFSVCKKAIALTLLYTVLFSVTNAQSATQAPNNSPESYRKAIETFHKLDQSNNYTESLAYADMNVLPMGIRQTINNTRITIAVSDIRWETTHSEITVFSRVEIPQNSGKDKVLFFGAQGIKLSFTGDIVGDASLVLMGDVSIPINGNTASLTLKGSFNVESGRAKELTYVSIDCQGFREMGINAEVEFPESLLQPVNEKGEVQTGVDKDGRPYRVRGGFQTIVKDWNDIMATISLPPFQINGLKDFIFTIDKAVFDFSDLRNDPNITYPQGYEANYMIPGNPALWRGVFVRELSITLPKPFSDKSKTRPSFIAQNMLIDNNGISGLFTAAGILPIDRGTASGWRFSVDAFTLGLEANRLTTASFSGVIGLPVSEKSNLGYDALITADNEYMLRVKPIGKFSFDVFHAQAEILPNSYVELRVVDDTFRPEALLHGSLNFAARLDGSSPQDSTGKTIAEFNGIEFRSLRLKTEAPMFTAEYFGYKGEIKMLNFPISLERIALRTGEKEIGLSMDIKLTLSDNLFTGSTRLEVIGTMQEKQDGERQWKYQKLKLNSIAINASVAETFTVKGELTILNDDPVYGDGFAGSIDLTLEKGMKGFNAKTRAMFGRTDFRYWFVDTRIKLPGQGVAIGPMWLTGFAGGASNRMKRTGGEVLESEIKSSQSGIVFKPDENTGLGIKAGVLFNVGSKSAMEGEASFEIAFNKHGGINFIGFYGFAQFVGKIPGAENIEKFVGDKFNKVVELEQNFVGDNPQLAGTLEKLKQYEPNEAAKKVFEPTIQPGETGFSAALGIQYDFTQQSLHATFDLYVNAAKGVVRGTASGNRAGWAVLHIEPGEWYLHMGTPTDRLGLKMGIGNILNVETGSYLMAGSRIPGSPPPPKEVADILGVSMNELDYMRDLNALGDGRGFAFGSSLRVATGDLTFLMLYANFQAGLGFDIMLKDYRDVQCEGRSDKIGFDGWYANGQAYAYLQGELGIKVNLWFIKAKVPIIKGAAAALLQAQLPNPVYVKGYMGVQFCVLGGLVSGSCRFKLTIGEKCELVIPGGSPLDFRMISDITPDDDAEAVDVFAAPQAAFTMRVGVPFEIQDDYGLKFYRINLTEFSISETGKSIPGKLMWSTTKDRVSFFSHEVLPPDKKLKATVKVGFEEWKDNRWVVVYNAGQKAEEIMEVSFTTGTAPDVIPLHNVQYAYPVVDQKFFLKDESTTGIVQLKRGQGYLFSEDYKHEIQVRKADGIKESVSFTYHSTDNRLVYTIPGLSTSQSYTLDVVSLKANPTGENVDAVTANQTVGEGDDVITVANKQATDVVRSDIGKSLLNYSFATSAYNTFSQKVQGIQKSNAIAGRLSSDVINLQYEVTGGEPFEVIELTGTPFTGESSLVKTTAVLTDSYYREDVYPLNYKTYPLDGIVLFRDTTEFGFPPVKSIPLSTAYLTEVENNNYTGLAKQRFPFIYNLPKSYKDDFVELQNKVVNRFLGTPRQSDYTYIINGYYRFIRPGNYKVRLQYVLPDGTKGSSADFDFYNFIK